MSNSPRRFRPAEVPLRAQHLIEASAGTGKTYNLASIYERLVVEEGFDVERILVVTFTRAATAELRQRLRLRLRERLRALQTAGNVECSAHVQEQLRRFDLAAIYTIHGFCERVLGRHAFETRTPFRAEVIDTDEALQQEVCGDLYSRYFFHTTPTFAVVAQEEKVNHDKVSKLLSLAARTPELPIVHEPRGELRDTWPEPPEPSVEPVRHCLEAVTRATRLTPEQGARIARWYTRHFMDGHFYAPSNRYLGVPRIDVAHWCRTVRALDQAPDPLDLQRVRFLHSGRIMTKFKLTPRKGVMAELASGNELSKAYAILDQLADAAEALYWAERDTLADHQRRLVRDGERELSDRPARRAQLPFREQVLELERALRGDGATSLIRSLSARFDAALIDEFQDTDPRQTFIFQTLFGPQAGRAGKPVFFVGDPKQAVYSFRGADLEAYLAERRRPGLELHHLDTNFRSSPTLLRGLNYLYGRAAHAFGWTSGIEYRAVTPSPAARDELVGRAPFEIVWAHGEGVIKPRRPEEDPDGEPLPGLSTLVANDIRDLLSGDTRLRGEPIRPGQIAVLVRKNREGVEIQQALRALNIPHVLRGQARVVDSREASELAIVIDAVDAPTDRRLLGQALVTQLVGVNGDELGELLQDEVGWEHWVTRFRDTRARWLRHGFGPAMAGLFDELDTYARLLRLPSGERSLTDLRHLLELLDGAARRDSLGPTALAQRFATMRLGADAGVDSELLLQRLERDADVVQILTIHKAKGLEFDVVYCPFLTKMRSSGPGFDEAFVFHDPTDEQRAKLHLGLAWRPKEEPQSPLVDIYAAEHYREEARLTYVALTRARQLLVAYATPAGGRGGPVSAPWAHILWGDESDQLQTEAQDRIQKTEPKDLAEALVRLAAESDGAIEARLPIVRAAPYTPTTDEGEKLDARKMERSLPPGLLRTSYSALVRGAARRNGQQATSEAQRVTEAEGRTAVIEPDVDADLALTVPRDDEEVVDSPDLGRENSAMPLTDGSRANAAASAFGVTTQPRRVSLTRDVLVPGPEAGTMLHTILERADFQAPEALTALAEEEVQRAALDTDAAALTHAMGRIFAAPLSAQDASLRLDQIPRADRLDELHFEMTLAPRSALSARALARCLRKHGAPASAPGYAEAVGELGFASVRGYLTGDIDLLFCRHGQDGQPRFFVVDYKSNHLGDEVSAYAPDLLPAVMAHHHYFLQYHLYTVAAHRHLARVVADYDYDRHFGGVYYLFLRGMAPASGPPTPGHGVFFDRPAAALVDELSSLLARGAALYAGGAA